MRGMTNREVFGDQRGKASEGFEPQERHRGETNPEWLRRE